MVDTEKNRYRECLDKILKMYGMEMKIDCDYVLNNCANEYYSLFKHMAL